MKRFDFIHEIERDGHAFVLYEAELSTGRRFRNFEMHTVRGGQLVATEVYFGWDVPHRVPRGTHVDKEAK